MAQVERLEWTLRASPLLAATLSDSAGDDWRRSSQEEYDADGADAFLRVGTIEIPIVIERAWNYYYGSAPSPDAHPIGEFQ